MELEPYDVVRIGGGAFADIYTGYIDNHRAAVLKKFRLPVNEEYSETVVQCFLEAKKLKTLEHDNIVRYIDFFEEEVAMKFVLVSEFVDGSSLAELMEGGKNLYLLENNKNNISKSCWNGLTYLHDQSICHNDIKPSNILISKDLTTVKIADFGFALLKAKMSLQCNNSFPSTVMYKPPEFVSINGMRDPFKSDVYSMGAMLCEIYSGHPFWMCDGKPQIKTQVLWILNKQLMAMENKTDIEKPSCWRFIPRDIQKLLKNAIAPDAINRKFSYEMLDLFQDVAPMVKAMEKYNKVTQTNPTMDDLKIGALLGSGDFADVHLGMYHGLEVAIKLYRIRIDHQEYSEYVKKCNREASLLKSLNHENVLHFIDIIEQSSTRKMCLILEYVNGGSMERFCKDRTSLSDEIKMHIALSCWRGLCYLHENSIIHKDIKPENIMIGNDLKTVKIGGFALAKKKILTSIYSTGKLEGSPMYFPPELASAGKEKPYRRHPQMSDVYSMGATLCVFFSEQPFWTLWAQNADEARLQLLMKLCMQWDAVNNNKEPEEPGCWKGISFDLQNILIHAIDADYKKRKSAKDMLDLFQKAMEKYNKVTQTNPTMDDLKIGALLGSGDFADVHLGMYHGLEVAIKLYRIRIDHQEYSEYVKKCNREASLLKSLNHENVLHFIDIIEQSSTRKMCLILEYVNGGSMERFCKDRTSLSDEIKMHIALSCWRGLCYLHENSIIHKDIKPENIMIGNDLKTVKICDFGLAEIKILTSIYSTCTLAGSYMYLPPELSSAGKEKPYRRHSQMSDVYSMGATLCVFFSGQSFWTVGAINEQEAQFKLLHKLVMQWEAVNNNTKEPEEPSCWKGISFDLQNILIYAINADYKKRKSAKDMFDLFQKAIEKYKSAAPLISLEEARECEKLFHESGMEPCLKYVRERQINWKSVPLNVAVIGNSGVGKSSFINAIRNLNGEEAEAARTSVNECTAELTAYEHPANPKLLFWDLPGVNTLKFPKNTYLETVKIERYDFFMILSANRFTEIDAWLAREIEGRRKKLFFVRTMIDVDVKKDKKAQPRTHDVNKVLDSIRKKIEENLHEINVRTKFFLIDNYEKSKYDFGRLQTHLVEDFDQLKREALVISLNAYTEDMMRSKVEILRNRAWYAAFFSAAGSAMVRNVVVDFLVLREEIGIYMTQLGLSPKSLKAMANLLSVEESDLIVAVLKNFPKIVKSVFYEGLHTGVLKLLIESQVEMSLNEEMLFHYIPNFGGTMSSFKTNFALLNHILDTFQDIAIAIVSCYTEKSIK